jgi:hypothetical protein
VADLHHRHADAWKGDKVALSLFEDRKGKNGWTSREVVNAMYGHGHVLEMSEKKLIQLITTAETAVSGWRQAFR